jgi:hypothetical protein
MFKIIGDFLADFAGDLLSFVRGLNADGLLDLALNAQDSLVNELGGGLDVQAIYTACYSAGIALIVFNFLKKGFETYVLWTDGDPDADTMGLLQNFGKALVAAIVFPTVYSWLVRVIKEFMRLLLNAVKSGTSTVSIVDNLLAFIAGGPGMFTLILVIIWLICLVILYFSFLVRGLQMFALRLGVPLAVIGLLQADKGVWRGYAQKMGQIFFGLVVQLLFMNISISLIMTYHFIWGIATIVFALKTPSFLAEFLYVGERGGGNLMMKTYYGVQFGRMIGAAAGKA